MAAAFSRPVSLALTALLTAIAMPGATLAQEAAWQLLRQPGHVVLMRHSEAPGHGGYGDPAGFRLEDCATQRNLSEEGRAHARRAGEAFRKNGIAFDRVLTSPWCRCKDTAELATGRGAETMEALSNLVGRQQNAPGQVAALKAYLAALNPQTRVLLVTHGVVINALTGIIPASGEMVIVRPGPGGSATVAARLRVD